MRFLSRARMLLCALLLMVSTGCRASLRAAAAEAPHAAVPVAIDETLKAGEDARTRERIVAVLATPEMKQAIAEVARSAVAAALEEAASEASQERIAELTKVVARALAESIASDILPAVVAGTRESLRENVSPRDMRDLEGALGSLAAASTSAAMRSAAHEVPATLGPAVRESLARELQAPDLREALSGLVGDATKQVLVSSRQAVVEAQADNRASGTPGLIERVRRLLTFSWIIAFAFGVIGVALGAWVLRMRRRTKRYRGAILELMTKDKGRERDESQGDPQRVQRLLELLQ